MRNADKSFTGTNILNAANDAKALGFSPHDKEAVLDHANIDHYAADPRGANKALLEYQRLQRQDEELHRWRQQLDQETDPEKQEELKGQIKARTTQYREQSGVKRQRDASQPKGAKAIDNRSDAIDWQVWKEQSRDQRLQNGPASTEAPKNLSQAEMRSGLSDQERKQVAMAEQKQLEASSARSDSSRSIIGRSKWSDDDEPNAAQPSQAAKAESPTQPAVVVRTAAKDEPAAPKAATAEASAGKPEAAKDQKAAAGDKKTEPVKPADPPKKLAGTVAAPRVG